MHVVGQRAGRDRPGRALPPGRSLSAGRVTVDGVARRSRPDFDFGPERAAQPEDPDDGRERGPDRGRSGGRSGAGLAIKGTVTTPDGKPVPGAMLTAAAGTRSGAPSGPARRTCAPTASSTGSSPSRTSTKRPYTLWASHPDHPEAELKGVAGGTSGVKLAFPPDTVGLRAGGRARTAKPITHYTITVLARAQARRDTRWTAAGAR